jgi:hypothetical protein
VPAPARLLEARAFAVLVDGDELIARPALAALFAARFGPRGRGDARDRRRPSWPRS